MNTVTLQNLLLDKIHSPYDLKELSLNELKQLCDELRHEIIQIVSKTGGHLGANLGVVELTVALHSIFNTPTDKLIWDVGHQSYPHKILTGRRHAMTRLRQGGGPSGFTRRSESEYDPFGTAHAATSISAALGFSVARDLLKEDFHVISVIGDGAMSSGMAFEALNNAGAMSSRLLVILNDNDMSIAPPVGALSAYFSRLLSSDSYHSLREVAKGVVSHLPKSIENAAKRAEEYMRGFIQGGTLFEELGFYYVGPVDGHNLEHLLPVLKNVRDRSESKPVLLHVVTKKGHGYAPAEKAPDKYHGVNKFDVITGIQQQSKAVAPSYTKVFAQSLTQEAKTDDKIVAITAAMPSGTGLDLFAKEFPNRMFDVGIAEQHAVTFAAGLACEGLKPFVAIYSTFLQRAYDSIAHDVALQKLPVRFAIDRAGLVGADGATHAGSFDLAYLCCLPHMVVMAPSDEVELMHMVATASAYNDGPIAFRYPRGDGLGLTLPSKGEVLPIGKGKIVREGKQIAFLSIGTRLHACLKAAEELNTYGLSSTVADARFAKPLDEDLIKKLALTHSALIIVEEGSRGGFGAHVLDFLANEGLLDTGLYVRSLTLPDTFIDHDTQENQYIKAQLDQESIVKKALNLFKMEYIKKAV